MNSTTDHAVHTIVGSFEVNAWDEQPLDERGPDQKLTRAAVRKTYTGDAVGTSITEWVMAYAPDGTASFVGMERLTGDIDGRRGSIVLRHVGRYEDGAARGTLEVVSGSGTGELMDAAGGGGFVADPGGSITLELTLP